MKTTLLLFFVFTCQILVGQSQREIVNERIDTLDKLFHIEKNKNKEKAFKYLDTIYNLAISVRDTYQWTRILLNKEYLVNDSIKKVLSDSLEALFVGREKDDIYYYHLLSKAISIHQNKEYEKAIEKYLFISEKIDTSIKGYLNLKTRLLTNVASAERTLGNYDNAIAYLSEGIDINENYPKKLKEIIRVTNLYGLYNGLGLIFRRIQKYEEAHVWFEKAALLVKDDNRIYNPLLNSMNVLIHLEEFEKVDSIGVIISKGLNKMKSSQQFNFYNNKARSFIHQKKYVEAEKSLSECRKINGVNNLSKVGLLADEAEIYFYTKRYKKAQDSYKKYLELMPDNYRNSVIRGLKGYINSYLSIKNSKAQEYFKRYDSLSRENYKKNLESGIQEWEVKYKTQQKESEIVQLKQESEIKSLSLKVNKLWMTLLGGFLILMTGLLYYFRKSLKQQKATSQYLDSQKQQLQNDNTSLLEKIGTWDQAKNTFFIIPGKENRKVRFDEIVYISSDGNEVIFHTTQKKYRAWLRLKDLETKLPNEHFVRSHRSFIINIHHATFENNKYLLMSNGDTVGLSKSYKIKIEEALKQ